MKTPFANFFSKVFRHKDVAKTKQPHKPEPEVKEETKKISIPRHETHAAPVNLEDQKLSRIRAQRKITNRMQRESRRINRVYA